MAKKKKKTKKVFVSIELGLGGLAGLAITTFCIFLWMFLFGMWTGQSVLQSSDGVRQIKESAVFAAKIWPNKTEDHLSKKESNTASRQEKTQADDDEEKGTVSNTDGSFFAVQVSAFKDRERAIRAVAQWRDKKYKSFYLMPDLPNGKFHRVFVGHFESLADANTLAAKLESSEQRKVFIMLISADQEQLP